ncbi:MAG TPA: lytic transglycosylase domain-containing protein, partial [Steroidobacteraceae bacterium]|nr:lytic transglycosylase domain-containing protein [Steroidobacteraceae bacterium]
MNSTRGAGASGRWGWLWAVILMPLAIARAPAADQALPYPPQLQRDVDFWVRVYTQIDTNSGYLHDQYNLGVVYDTLHFGPNSSPRARQRIVNQARDHYVAELRRIASGQNLSIEDQHIKALWGAEATPERLLEATEDIRFQLGQSNRFRDGLIRSGAWQQDIAQALKDEGLPPQLAALPLVESSYNPRAYSKVGAAGLWQFMPSTGRRFMRIDRAVDDRMDPFAATEAAAQLLAYNYRILGTWPLALTAYNHGVAGMRRAVETTGTTNIVTIVRDYQSRTFGFASRNFYVSFLAALKIERNPQKYFGAIVPLEEARFREVRMPAYVSVGPLERALNIDPERLRDLNPALRPAVWRGRLAVPRGYELRLPAGGATVTTAMLAKRLGPQLLLAGNVSRHTRAFASRPQLVAAVLRPGANDGAAPVVASAGPAVASALPVVASAAQVSAAGVRVGTSSASVGASAAPVLASAGPAYYSRVRFAASVSSEATSMPAAPEGDSLPEAAARFGLGSQRLLDFNGIDRAAAETVTGPDTSLMSSEGGAAQNADAQSDEGTSADEQPVSAAQADEESPSLGPTDGSAQNPDPTDYSVGPKGTIYVAAAETLGHYADWLGVRASDLRRINHMRFHQPVIVGRRIRLDFRRVPAEEFEARRRQYHQALEASYFASHRIVGTQQYVAQSGDSLWTLTQRFAGLPLWLLRQYNP